MTKVISVDPGVTTGVTIVEEGKYSFWEIDCFSLEVWETFLMSVNPDAIMYEDFKHRPNLMKAELYSIQVIGVTRLYAEKAKVPIIFTCLPTEAKDFWDNSKIKKLALWQPGKGHAMDALRVYLTYKQKNDIAWFSEIVHKLKD